MPRNAKPKASSGWWDPPKKVWLSYIHISLYERRLVATVAKPLDKECYGPYVLAPRKRAKARKK